LAIGYNTSTRNAAIDVKLMIRKGWMHKGTAKGKEELKFHSGEVEVCSALEFVDDLWPRINVLESFVSSTKRTRQATIYYQGSNVYS
jgi:hypothetical protein